MKSLSQSEYGNLRSLYESVYAPKFESILDEFTDEDLDDLTDEYIEEQVTEFFQECLEEGLDIEIVEQTICESIDSSLDLLTERVDPKETQRRRDQAKDRLETSRAMRSAAAKSTSSDSSNKRADRLSQIKGVAKKVGSALKTGAKAAKTGAKAAGKAAQGGVGLAARAVGTAQRAASAVKSAAKSGYERGKQGSGGSSSGGGSAKVTQGSGGTSSAGSSTSSAGTSSAGSSSSSDSGSSSSAPAPRKRRDGLLKRGLKKLVRGAAKAVSVGAGAVKAGADYVADKARKEELEATGLFSEKEIEAIMEAEVQELYKGKHGQSDKEYMDGRSDAGKQISGDSKMSGAAYSHRSFKGQGKPAKPGERQKAQGRMTPADRNELAIRKAALKKEEVEVEEGYKEIDAKKHGRMYDRYKKLRSAAMQDARDSGEASGENRMKMGKMSAVIDKSSENLRKKQTRDQLTGRG